MKTIRRLYLQNTFGQRWGLNGDRGVYCTDLAGFGLASEPTFNSIGNGFFSLENANAESQSRIPFTLVFTKNPYESYQMLLDWVMSAETVTIIYNPTGKQEYCKDVAINFIQKGELTRVGWLECPCSIYGITPWYLPSPTLLTIRKAKANEQRRYTYMYTDVLKYGMDSAAALSATIAGAGHMPGALDLSYYGAIKNPHIKLTGNISGKTLGFCSVATVLEATDVLRFSTKYDESFVKKISASGLETDLLDSVDISLTPFFRVPVNEPCTLSIESDDFFSGRAEVLVYYYYRSV